MSEPADPTSGQGATTSQTGTVSVQRVAAGSKSEQDTVVLTTAERAWLLRRAGGSGFGPDPALAELDGRTVTVTGYAGGAAFLVTEEPDVHG